MARKKSKGGQQQGPQRHAEGEHGEKTRNFIRTQQIVTPPRDQSDGKGPRHDPAEIAKHDTVGKNRLFENRQQHDEAEKGSETTRQTRDVQRHKHDAPGELVKRNEQKRQFKF